MSALQCRSHQRQRQSFPASSSLRSTLGCAQDLYSALGWRPSKLTVTLHTPCRAHPSSAIATATLFIAPTRLPIPLRLRRSQPAVVRSPLVQVLSFSCHWCVAACLHSSNTGCSTSVLQQVSKVSTMVSWQLGGVWILEQAVSLLVKSGGLHRELCQG